MIDPISPTSHTLYHFQAILVRTRGLSPTAIRPEARLAELVPVEHRPLVWHELRREGLYLPSLDFPPQEVVSIFAHAFHATAWLAFMLQNMWAFACILPISWFLSSLNRHAANQLDDRGPCTVWEAVVYLTPFRRYRYPWSHAEIETKVRLILAKALDVPLECVTPEARLEKDLGAGSYA
jgi:hypothetical protein